MTISADVIRGTGKCPVCGLENAPLVEVMEVLVCQKCATRKGSTRIRKRIQEIYDRQQAKQKQEAWSRRMDHVRKGVELFKQKKPSEALRHFRDYVSILESKYGVGSGGLFPALFGTGKESGEIILISGVYWDMAKIYDQMKGHTTEMRHCLNKFVEFTSNRRHSVVAAEAVRKYLGSELVVHREDFKNVRSILTGHLKKCFVASVAFGEDSPEVELLRRYRDDVLDRTPGGRLFIRAYYACSPALAEAFGRSPSAVTLIRGALRPVIAFCAKRLR